MTHLLKSSIVFFTQRATTFAVAAVIGLGAAEGLAQPIQFDWETTTPGYSAEITLDRPSSTDGGLSDIVSASITTPDFGTLDYNPATANLNGVHIVWSSSELTDIILDWDVGPRFDQENLELAAGQYGGHIIDFNSGAPDPFFYDIDQAGSWVAVPETNDTLILLPVALAALAAAGRWLKPRST